MARTRPPHVLFDHPVLVFTLGVPIALGALGLWVYKSLRAR